MADVYWTFFLLSIFKSKLFSFSFLIVHEFLLSERFSCGNAPLFTVIISVSIEHCQFFFLRPWTGIVLSESELCVFFLFQTLTSAKETSAIRMPFALILRARTTALAVLDTLQMDRIVKVGLVSIIPFNLLGQVFNWLGLNCCWSGGQY